MSSYNGKNWCGTVFDLEADAWLREGPEVWLKHLVDCGTCTYAVGQLEEAPDTGKQHIQCFLQLKKPARLSWLKRHVHETAHWEAMKGTAAEASEYCKKLDTRVLGPWEFGTITAKGKKMGLDDAVEMVRSGAPIHDIVEAFPAVWVHHGRGLMDVRQRLNLEADRRQIGPEGPEVWVLYGPSGTGKSRTVAHEWPDAFWKIPGEKWWDGYDGQETVVLDDFKSGELRLTDMQRLLDYNPLWVEVKGGAVPMKAKRYVITSNCHPSEWYPKADVHGTIMRRIHDFAEKYGRLLLVDKPITCLGDLQQGLGNTTPNPAAAQDDVDDAAWEALRD
uniref:Replication-associated protein n=1 Tax=Sichuan rat gut-associated circular DNA virus 3 TaxID=2863988 RepID=A0A8K1HIE0_9VIRU|nr:replication-associated protein [Sichuan rat gut-associated circular DNA virus 3]